MKFIIIAAAALLSVVSGASDNTCLSAPAVAPKPGVVCIVGTLRKGDGIRNVYFETGRAVLIVEKTDAACIRDTHSR